MGLILYVGWEQASMAQVSQRLCNAETVPVQGLLTHNTMAPLPGNCLLPARPVPEVSSIPLFCLTPASN